MAAMPAALVLDVLEQVPSGRVCWAMSNDALFIYVALDRSRANLALARHYLSAAEKELVV